MKYLFLILVVSLIYLSCDNELDISEDWKNIPVVYGIIDGSDTAHYFRIEKAFYDKKINAYTLAAIPDSIYYSDAEVFLLDSKTKQRYVLHRVDGNLEGYTRNEGIFAQSPNYLYKIKADELKAGQKSSLDFQLLLNQGQDTIFSSTVIVRDFSFAFPKPVDPNRLNFSSQNNVNIRWTEAGNAAFYDVAIRLNYRQRNVQTGSLWESKSIEWIAGRFITTTSAPVKGQDFYANIAGLIKPEPFVERKYQNLDIIITGFGKEVFDYINIYKANLGITGSQEIPLYSNIQGGVGIFSSKKTIELKGLLLEIASQDSLISGIYTKNLNFQ